MMFRCPYCGEESFSALGKMGLSFGKSTSRFSKCPNCKNICKRTSAIGGDVGITISHILIGLLLGLCSYFTAVTKHYDLAIVMILLLAVLYMAFNYFFCHYDKLSRDKVNEKSISIEVESGVLWPAIRKGEIYAIVPQRSGNSNREADYTIAMLKKTVKSAETIKLIFDIIKDPADPKAELVDAVIIRGFGKGFVGKIYAE